MDRDIPNRETGADAKDDEKDIRWYIPHFALGIPKHSELNNTLFLQHQLS